MSLRLRFRFLSKQEKLQSAADKENLENVQGGSPRKNMKHSPSFRLSLREVVDAAETEHPDVTRLKQQVSALQQELQEARDAVGQRSLAPSGGARSGGALDGHLRVLQLEMDTHRLRLELAASRSSLECEARKRGRQARRGTNVACLICVPCLPSVLLRCCSQEKVVSKLMKELREAKLLAGARESTLSSVERLHTEV